MTTVRFVSSVANGRALIAKRNALAKHLGVNKDEIFPSDYDDDTFEYGNDEYKVYTDREATIACNEQIKDSLWAFNSEFLASYTRVDSKVFEALAGLCEDANDAVLSIIEGTKGKTGFTEFAKRAVNEDGRGHFLASYDSEESECGKFYAYRTN